jgi:hypothetical protein
VFSVDTQEPLQGGGSAAGQSQHHDRPLDPLAGDAGVALLIGHKTEAADEERHQDARRLGTLVRRPCDGGDRAHLGQPDETPKAVPGPAVSEIAQTATLGRRRSQEFVLVEPEVRRHLWHRQISGTGAPPYRDGAGGLRGARCYLAVVAAVEQRLVRRR